MASNEGNCDIEERVITHYYDPQSQVSYQTIEHQSMGRNYPPAADASDPPESAQQHPKSLRQSLIEACAWLL